MLGSWTVPVNQRFANSQQRESHTHHIQTGFCDHPEQTAINPPETREQRLHNFLRIIMLEVFFRLEDVCLNVHENAADRSCWQLITHWRHFDCMLIVSTLMLAVSTKSSWGQWDVISSASIVNQSIGHIKMLAWWWHYMKSQRVVLKVWTTFHSFHLVSFLLSTECFFHCEPKPFRTVWKR